MDNVASSVVNGLLSIKPLAAFAKHKARNMMMDRAETIGVYWRDEVKTMQRRADAEREATALNAAINPIWDKELAAIANPNITYPSYYLTSFHAYEEGNLGWLPAMEVDVAARAVHARIWDESDARAGIEGDASLRASFHQILVEQLGETPHRIVDLGCSTGRSTFALQDTFPHAEIVGVDLSAYFLTVAQYQAQKRKAIAQPVPAAALSTDSEPTPSKEIRSTQEILWAHAAAEDTKLPANSVNLVSACLIFHELPANAAKNIITEAARILKPGGTLAIMDMNPESGVYAAMPPYILTLLKSTEPYLDQYFSLDMAQTFEAAGFETPSITVSTPRHRAIIGKKKA